MNIVEDKIDPTMESKSDYEEWLQSGNEKAEEIIDRLDNDKKE